MKTSLVRLTMALVIVVVISASMISPVVADAKYTGWADFNPDPAEFSMCLFNYYGTDTTTSVYLAQSSMHIDNWGDEPLCKLTTRVYSGTGACYNTAVSYPTIDPDEYYQEYLSLGYCSYTKDPGGWVQSESFACWDGMCVWHGMWEMLWHRNLTITWDYST